MKLNIGSGRKRLEGYVNIDMNPKLNPDLVCNLASEGWPISDGIVTEGVCSHVMEHLPNTPEPFFHFLRELYRVCANGAVIHVAVPHPRNDLFFRDPTHVRPILPDMLVPFSKRQHAEEWARGNMLHPWHEEIGVNFDVGNPYYILDERALKLNPPPSPENFAMYEAHYFNIVFEIQFTLTAVKENA
jgi:hypothetical protein